MKASSDRVLVGLPSAALYERKSRPDLQFCTLHKTQLVAISRTKSKSYFISRTSLLLRSLLSSFRIKVLTL